MVQTSLFPRFFGDSTRSFACACLCRVQYGDLSALGLGLSLLLLDLSSGLPWLHTIVAGTLLSRLLLVPFSIKKMRNSAALTPHQPRLLELKVELERAYKTGGKLAVQRVALKQRRVYEESGVSMLPMLLLPFVQLPVTLGMFFGVKRLCALPLEQLHSSGVSILPDLTVPDPFYVLPIAAAVLMNAQLSVRTSMVHAFFTHADVYHRLAQATWLRPRTARLRLI